MFEGATPEPGARLDSGPHEIVLRFNEPVTPVAVHLLDTQLADTGGAAPPESDGNTVRLRLAGTLPDGQYLVTYRVISEDAHPVAASFEFTVGEPGSTRQIAGPVAPAGDDLAAAGLAIRALTVIALLLAAGSALFMALPGAGASAVVLAGTGSLAGIASLTALVLTVVGFGVSGAEMVGGGAGAVVSREAWAAAAHSTLGVSTLVAFTGLVSILAGLQRRAKGVPVRAVLIAGAVLVASSRGLTGHPAATSGVTMIVMGGHVLLAAFWGGSLWPLWTSLRADPPTAARALMDAFSRLAVVAVLLLVVLGAYMAWVHVGSVTALTHSGYGRLLSGKLVLVAFLLGLAVINKLWLTPRLASPDGAAIGRMRRSIGVEMVLMALLLVASASLAHTPPPRSPAATHAPGAAAPLQGMVMEGDYHVAWKLTPATVGPGTRELTLRIQRHDGTPVDPLSVSASVALPARGIEPLTVPLVRRGPGEYVATVRGMSVTGEWVLDVEALVTDFDKVVLEAPVAIE
jgi:copper transport protein